MPRTRRNSSQGGGGFDPIPAIDIGLRESATVVETLNRLLADEFVLYTKTRNFHWNVQGPTFRSLHLLFEDQYRALNKTVDEVAERVRTLGGFPLGSLEEFLKTTRLSEVPGGPRDANAMVAELVADHEAAIRHLREAIDETGRLGDQGTQDFLLDALKMHEKTAWMLRSTVAAFPQEAARIQTIAH